jgi:D-tyrosyl-tRNA(Tyr) deacylase
MIALLQRVSSARVAVEERIAGEIGAGLLAMVCAERGDTGREAGRLLERVLGYRVFADAAAKMNLSLTDVKGGLLLVPQFTLAADTKSGMRPSFTPAAEPAQGQYLFDYMLDLARKRHSPVAAGVFGANMQVTLTNDGPVTFWLRVEPGTAPA